jgi:uncharacterized protein (TIGR02300 family)
MANLGNKHECYSCGTKFYDLGKPEALCPKCGANQKDARKHDAAAETAAVKRKKREEPVAVAEVEQEDLVPAGDEDFGDEELVTPEGVDDEESGDEGDDFDDDDAG